MDPFSKFVWEALIMAPMKACRAVGREQRILLERAYRNRRHQAFTRMIPAMINKHEQVPRVSIQLLCLARLR